MPVASLSQRARPLQAAFGRLLAAKKGSLPRTPSLPKTRHSGLGDMGKDRQRHLLRERVAFLLSGKGVKEMAAITQAMIQAAYEQGKCVYLHEIDMKTAIAKVVDLTDMNPTSAANYLSSFMNMMKGITYKRTVSYTATAFFLDNIGKEFGVEKQRDAATAVKNHVAYYATINGYQKKIDVLAQSYLVG